MSAIAIIRHGLFVALGFALLTAPAASQTQIKIQPKVPGVVAPKSDPNAVQPKMELVAETKLLMEGLAHANFRGLERLLVKAPEDPKDWTFARGQAIIIAETGNLLMLRPPKSSAQSVWFSRAMEMRDAAKQLARTVAAQDYEKSRAGLLTLGNACNHCHQSFRVAVEIMPFADKALE